MPRALPFELHRYCGRRHVRCTVRAGPRTLFQKLGYSHPPERIEGASISFKLCCFTDLDRIEGWSTIDDGSDDDDESLGCYAEESVKSSELLKQSTAATAAAQTIQTQELPQTEAAAPPQMPPHVKRHQVCSLTPNFSSEYSHTNCGNCIG